MKRGISSRMVKAIRERAAFRCEYCHEPERLYDLVYVVDHIIARQHKGTTTLDNLALCCGRCNSSKGPNLSGIDPRSRLLTRLFHPRLDEWTKHFRWEGPRLVGLTPVGRTPVGRTTVEVLAINSPARMAVRRILMDVGALKLG